MIVLPRLIFPPSVFNQRQITEEHPGDNCLVCVCVCGRRRRFLIKDVTLDYRKKKKQLESLGETWNPRPQVSSEWFSNDVDQFEFCRVGVSIHEDTRCL